MPYYIEAVDLTSEIEEACTADQGQANGSGASRHPIGLSGPFSTLRKAHRAVLDHQDCPDCRPTGRILRGKSQNDVLTIVAVEGAATGFER